MEWENCLERKWLTNIAIVVDYIYLRKPTGFGDSQTIDSIKFDGLTDVYNNILMGSCVEKVCSEMGISREAQDEFAIESYNKARAA